MLLLTLLDARHPLELRVREQRAHHRLYARVSEGGRLSLRSHVAWNIIAKLMLI